MNITIRRSFVYKALICLGALLAVVAIFCFFGNAIEWNYDGSIIKYYPSVFNYMFGSKNAISCAGLIVLFVFELIALLGGITLVVILFMEKLSKKHLIIYILSLAGLLLVCAILSFCTKAFIVNAYIRETPEAASTIKEFFENAQISSGAVSYSVLTLIGFVSLGSSALVLNRKEY